MLHVASLLCAAMSFKGWSAPSSPSSSHEYACGQAAQERTVWLSMHHQLNVVKHDSLTQHGHRQRDARTTRKTCCSSEAHNKHTSCLDHTRQGALDVPCYAYHRMMGRVQVCGVQELTQRLYRLACSIVKWLDSLLPKAAQDDSILLRVEKLLTPLA